MRNVNGESVVKDIYKWLHPEQASEVAEWLDAYFAFIDTIKKLKVHPAWFLDDGETWSPVPPVPLFVPAEAFDECDLDHFKCADGRPVWENILDFDLLTRLRTLDAENQECEKLMADLEGGLTTIKQ